MYSLFTLATAHEKGTALEAVVSAIETLILDSSPSIKAKTHTIESRKRVEAAGVQHEIDLHVTTEVAQGYRAVFIFECKNWKDKVDKNEIIVFSEKIKICNAQYGYFVAKSFTSDAEAQAKKDPRIILKLVTEHDPASTILPFGFNYTFQTPTAVKVKYKRRGSTSAEGQKLEIGSATGVLNGVLTDLGPLANQWATEAINESMRTFPSGTLPDGLYERSCHSTRDFEEGQFTVNGIDIGAVDLEVTFQIRLKWPVVTSHFEVDGRGRVISLEGFTYGDASINKVEFIFGPANP